jgi:hypothetical protein
MLWVAGGTTASSKRLNDVWRFDPLAHTWTEVASGGGGRPKSRAWSAANGYDRSVIANGALIAFGEPQVHMAHPHAHKHARMQAHTHACRIACMHAHRAHCCSNILHNAASFFQPPSTPLLKSATSHLPACL